MKLTRSSHSLWLFALLTALLLLVACSSAAGNANPQSLDIQAPYLSLSLGQDQPQSTPATGNIDLSDETSEDKFLLIEEVIIGLLFIATLVGIAAHRLRVPYTVGLVLMGLALTLAGQVDLEISPNLILALLVPPLIFEAAFHLNFYELQKNFMPILALAIPGVLLTTGIVGGIVAWGAHISLPVALVFGAVVSATDPVSVVALFRSLGIPKRLQVLLEGESLFNDGTAIVVFDLMVAFAAVGATQFNLVSSVVDFIRIAGGGLVIGLLLGAAVSNLISRIDDYLIETTLTSVLAYGAYLIAELLGFSGVLAVVAAGLINGNIGPRGMSPTTRIVVYNFWEYAGFLANSFIFLLIGLQIELARLFENWVLIVWAVAGVLVSRAIGVYGLSWLERSIPFRWQHVLYWGGLRGAISLALVLSLPGLLPESSDQIQIMTFGVVLFTLLVQGFTMKPLVKMLNLVERKEIQDEYERRHARAVAMRAAYDHLETRNSQGMLSDHSWQLIAPLLKQHNQALVDAVREIMTSDPSVESEELDTARREALHAQRSTMKTLLQEGVLSEHTYEQLIADIDAALITPQTGWPDLLGSRAGPPLDINRLMTAVIQAQDVENAINALTKLGVSVTQINSSGGLANTENTTILIGLVKGQEEAIVSALQRSCQRRVKYVIAPFAEALQGLSAPMEIQVGGATIFVFDVERFESF